MSCGSTRTRRSARGELPRIADQLAEDTPSSRKVTDRGTRLGVDAHGQEALELFARFVEDAEGRVPGARQLARDVEQTLEQLLDA